MKLNQWITKWSGVWSLALLVGTGLPAADFPEGLRVGQITVSSSSEPATFALASDGELYLWGARGGLTPVEDMEYYLDRPQRVIRPEFVNRWREVAVGDYHVLALVNNGEIVVWGSNHNGQLGTGVLPPTGELYGTELPALLARPAGVNRWLASGAHDDSSQALSDDGRLWVWGRNNFGQLGLLHTNDVAVPTPQPFPPGVTRYERLFPKAQPFALGDEGELYAWGGWGHVGQPYTNIVLGPVRVPKPVGLNEWRELAKGYHHVLALNEQGELFAWGENYNGQLGIAGVVRSAEPQRVALPEGVSGWRRWACAY